MTAGRRIYPDADGMFQALEPGDYMHTSEVTLYWPPGAAVGPWAAHADKKITEHDDGTITVMPSILCTYAKQRPGMPGAWHGFLVGGVWRECA
jgi:hypothetical protein